MENGMKLSGKVSCDLEGVTVKMYGKEGVRLANTTIRFKVREDEAAGRFGADLHHAAFASMRTIDGVAKHSCASMAKPRVVVEQHEIDLVGHAIKCTPEVSRVDFVDDEPVAVITCVLPIVCKAEQKDLMGDLTTAVGTVIHPTWEAVQGSLPLGGPTPPTVIKPNAGPFGNPKPTVA